MRSSSVYIISVFLVVKIFQLINSFIFAHLLGNEQGSTIMIGSLLLMGGIFIFGLLVKKFLPPSALKSAWIFIVLFLIVTSLVNPTWTIIFLSAIFLYALIGTESQVLRSLNSFKNIPQFLPFLLTLLPVVISYQFPQARIVTPQLFYIVSSVFALLASYSVMSSGGNKFIIYGEAPPLWLGLLFMIGSGLVYYLIAHSESGDMPAQILAFVMLFYVGGALVIYMALDSYLKRVDKT